MPPFDLPDNLFDLMHADLCRPAEVREEYISKPPYVFVDDKHVHDVESRRDTSIVPGTGTLTIDVAEPIVVMDAAQGRTV